MFKAKTLAAVAGVAMILSVSGTGGVADAYGDRYGSIAYSHSTGRFGSAWSFASRFDADEQALASCNRPDCRTLVWFRNGCGALARASNGAIAWAWSGSLVDAKRRASNQCTREWGSCKLICSVCSGGDNP